MGNAAEVTLFLSSKGSSSSVIVIVVASGDDTGNGVGALECAEMGVEADELVLSGCIVFLNDPLRVRPSCTLTVLTRMI